MYSRKYQQNFVDYYQIDRKKKKGYNEWHKRKVHFRILWVLFYLFYLLYSVFCILSLKITEVKKNLFRKGKGGKVDSVQKRDSCYIRKRGSLCGRSVRLSEPESGVSLSGSSVYKPGTIESLSGTGTRRCAAGRGRLSLWNRASRKKNSFNIGERRGERSALGV